MLAIIVQSFLSLFLLSAKRNVQYIIAAITCVFHPCPAERKVFSHPVCVWVILDFLQSVGPLVFTLTLLQSLLFSAGHNPSDPGQPCDGTTSGMCVVPWLGGTISVSGVLLVANGLSFGVSIEPHLWTFSLILQILTLLFITFGSVADYGFNGRWMLIGVTLIFWGSQFALVSVKCMFFLQDISDIIIFLPKSCVRLANRDGTVHRRIHFTRMHARFIPLYVPSTGEKYP